MPWTVAIDESGNDGTSPIVTMSGLIANESFWTGFDREWRSLLGCHGLTEIHTYKLRRKLSGDRAKFNQIMEEVREIFHKYIPVSVAVVMRKDDYDEIYKPTQSKGGPKRGQLGVLYQALVSFAVSFLESFPPSDLDQLNFIYEKIDKPGGLQAIHDAFKRDGNVAGWFGPLKFATRSDVLGLQGADCLASGSLQCEMELHGAEPTDIAQSQLVVIDPQMAIKAPMSFRLPITRDILEALRDDLLLTKGARAAILRKAVQC